MSRLYDESTRNGRIKRDVLRYLLVIGCSILYSVGVEIFLDPIKLVSLGLTSVGQIFGNIVSANWAEAPTFLKSPGIYVMVLNIPLLIWGFKELSPKFVIFTIVSIVVQTVFMLGWIDGEKILTEFFKIGDLTNNGTRLFLAIIGGLVCGTAIGIALRYGASTGGIDIVAQIVSFKKGISIGIFEMLVNVILAIVNGLIVNDMSASLFTFIFIIIYALVVDKVHTTYNFLRVDIITNDKDNVSKALIDEIKRGCTAINVEGEYTKESKYDVFIVISSYELEKVRRTVHEIDPNAFIMVSPIKRVLGKFFKHTIS